MTTARRLRKGNAVIWLGVVAMMLLAGCSGNDGGAGVRLGGVTTSTTSSTEHQNAAPRVAEPLDVEGILDDPSDALATDQLSELGLMGPGETNNFGADDGCDWTVKGTILSTVTVQHDYFEETTIGGYPAVFASALDERDSGGCLLTVGLTDELAVSVDTTFLDIDPCPVAERTAEAMVEHLAAQSR
ncbi:DUF3558 domain-containing protein [Actinophytocola sp.]|uniref:DUF3558 domain-containing protein n=1 Tax=Actinophytocola sp. TaxID=1872138 RepID=UPI002ED0DD57